MEIHDEYGFVRMIRGERYKLVKRYTDHEDELYDMVSDPGETKNLIADPAYADIADELNAALEEWFDRYSDPANDGRKSVTLTGSGQCDLCSKPEAFVNQNTMYYTGKKPY